MGVQDREYYRDETRGGFWISGDAPTCRALIAANIAFFVLQKFCGPSLEMALQASSGHYEIWRFVTASFLHASPMQILFNMLFLWMVGREIEHIYGSRDFLAFYLGAAVVTTLTWTVCDRLTGDSTSSAMMGASAVILAVMVVYALYYPRREVLLFFVFPVEVWFLVVIYIVWNLLSLGRTSNPADYAAELSGAAFGYLYKVADFRISTLERWATRRRRPKLRIVAPDPREVPPKPTPVVRPTVAPSRSSSVASSSTATARPGSSFAIPQEQIEEKLDAILAKIAREGKAALSEEDHRILDEASRRFRDRRSERL